eukprot:539235_1
MTHSTDLQWQLVRQNNKFLQKRGGLRFSNDPFNNTGLATRRHAGFVADKVAVVKVKNEKQLYVTLKDGSNLNQPRKMYTKKVFDQGVKASVVSKAAGAVRPDLADIAFRRARKFSKVVSRTTKIRAARKECSAKMLSKTKKRKTVRPKKN